MGSEGRSACCLGGRSTEPAGSRRAPPAVGNELFDFYHANQDGKVRYRISRCCIWTLTVGDDCAHQEVAGKSDYQREGQDAEGRPVEEREQGAEDEAHVPAAHRDGVAGVYGRDWLHQERGEQV